MPFLFFLVKIMFSMIDLNKKSAISRWKVKLKFSWQLFFAKNGMVGSKMSQFSLYMISIFPQPKGFSCNRNRFCRFPRLKPDFWLSLWITTYICANTVELKFIILIWVILIIILHWIDCNFSSLSKSWGYSLKQSVHGYSISIDVLR